MKKYRCKICGYVYDDAKEAKKFEDLPDDWKCPWCGAPKSMFEEITEPKENETNEEKDTQNKSNNQEKDEDSKEDLRELSSYEIYYICTNLAKACEKQYLEEEQNLFLELSEFYKQKHTKEEGTLKEVLEKVTEDIDSFNKAMEVADKSNDRGAKRVITWASKTSNIVKTILDEYNDKGLDYLKNTKIWVCDICGFIYIGEKPPRICPVCKVPNFKILEVE